MRLTRQSQSTKFEADDAITVSCVAVAEQVREKRVKARIKATLWLYFKHRNTSFECRKVIVVHEQHAVGIVLRATSVCRG